jgi:hypothetical protein
MPTNDCAQKKRENESAGGRTTIGVSMHGLFFVVLSTTTNNDETTTNNKQQTTTTLCSFSCFTLLLQTH